MPATSAPLQSSGPTGTSVTANFSKVNNKIQQLIIHNIGSAYLDEVTDRYL